MFNPEFKLRNLLRLAQWMQVMRIVNVVGVLSFLVLFFLGWDFLMKALIGAAAVLLLVCNEKALDTITGWAVNRSIEIYREIGVVARPNEDHTVTE